VNQATQGLTSPTLQQATTVPPRPPSAAEPPEAHPEPDPPEAETAISRSPADAAAAPPDERTDATGAGEADHDEPDPDLKAFFEAAEISVTEVKNPPGGSLPF